MKTKDKYYLSLAKLISEGSSDPSTKVGCVLVGQDGVLLATGYNRFPTKVAQTEDRMNNREEKYRFVIHAEKVAIFNSSFDLRGATAYVTHAPCSHCQAAFAEVGIKKVVTGQLLQSWQDRFPDSYRVAEEIREECGIEFMEINYD